MNKVNILLTSSLANQFTNNYIYVKLLLDETNILELHALPVATHQFSM
jgi:hypothetical protein